VGLTLLAGDASTRSYLRAAPTRGESRVLMVTGESFDPESDPWLRANRLFLDLGLPVPRVFQVDGPAGVLVLEDLGDRLLQDLVAASPPGESGRVENLYRRALLFLATLRREGTPRAGELATASSFLDEGLFRRELEMFREHYLVGRLGLREGSAADRELRLELERLAAEAGDGPRALCHRDYHSRNLLVREAGLGLVDHQDARLGPDLYDLASLLRDPYVELEEELEQTLFAGFALEVGEDPASEERLLRFERTALQRDLKAIGTYGFQAGQRGRSEYLRWVPRAAALARRSLDRQPGRRHLGKLLEQTGLFATGEG
jgi:aminoglycoside/choline kinase family phosphotransferase